MILREKVAFITGAGSGIGKASALVLAQQGARIGALGRTEEELNRAVDEIRRCGSEAISLVADVTSPGDMQRAVQKTIDTWGRIDIVLANAPIDE